MSLPKVWTDGVNSWCLFSADRAYRYYLTRRLREDGKGSRVCIGLNPSTADETKDDPTVRRLAMRAYDDGFRSITMLNLFAYRATDPRKMLSHADPVGQRNDSVIIGMAASADSIVICWGSHGSYGSRSGEVLHILKRHRHNISHFGLTKSGEPRHPVRMAKNTPLVKWEYPT